MRTIYCLAAFAVLVHLYPSSGLAQPLSSCREQIELHCKAEAEKRDLREIVKCLVKNDDKLSVECKQEIQRFAQASRQTTPPGGGPMGMLAGLAGMGAQVPSLSYEGRFLEGQKASPKTPSSTENNLNVSVPVFKNEKNTVALTIGGGHLQFSEAVVLDSGKRVSSELKKLELGVQYSRRLEGQKGLGLRGSVGYAGDKISSRTESFNLSANYSFPGANEGIWVTMVMISNNSPFGAFVPIPGFFYVYRSPTFTGLFGVPILSLQWTPVNPWSYSLSLFGPTLRLEAAYGPLDRTQFFVGSSWRQQRYILSERSKDQERLTIEEKIVELGFRRPFFNKLLTEFQVGHSFDRSIYVGKGLFNDEGGRFAQEATWYLRWSLKATF